MQEGFSDGGFEELIYSHKGTPLLDSFYFRYTSSDHHLGGIYIRPDVPTKGHMQIAFHDKNYDDDYYYQVVHKTVDNLRIAEYSRGLDICYGKCNSRLTNLTVTSSLFLWVSNFHTQEDVITTSTR